MNSAALIYRSLLGILSPYLRWRFHKEGKKFQDPLFSRQRRGYSYPKFEQRPLWFHAASVGEVSALLPLIHSLHAEQPELAILITTNTASSGAVAREKLPSDVVHAYLPMDWPTMHCSLIAVI